jgi:hypothetical protein
MKGARRPAAMCPTSKIDTASMQRRFQLRRERVGGVRLPNNNRLLARSGILRMLLPNS